MLRRCEFCGNPFEVKEKGWTSRKRFCNNSCSAKWRNATYGPNTPSAEQRQQSSALLKSWWQDDEFRKSVVKRMTTNNPSFNPEVIEKAKRTKLQHGYIPNNNFKYGNGKVSEYEQKVYDKLIDAGFYYNYAIPTKLARDAFPDRKYPNSYKPDFVNLKTKLCIEIDGNNHRLSDIKVKDKKKEECLQFLGFTTVRFTHADIDKGEFDKWLSCYLKNC